jgi:hypothetical protein
LNIASHGPDLAAIGEQLPGDGAALVAGRPGDQDDVFCFIHNVLLTGW